MSLARCDEVAHVVIQSSHLRLGEFESHAAGLLQQYRPNSGNRRRLLLRRSQVSTGHQTRPDCRRKNHAPFRRHPAAPAPVVPMLPFTLAL
jgi:hypothetical protein